MKLAEKLTFLRDNKEVFQKELASYLKVSTGTISNYEKGIHEPDLDTLCRLADFYDVSTDYLLGRTSVPFPRRQGAASDRLEELLLDLSGLSDDNLRILKLFTKFLLRYELRALPKRTPKKVV